MMMLTKIYSIGGLKQYLRNDQELSELFFYWVEEIIYYIFCLTFMQLYFQLEFRVTSTDR